MDPITYTGPQPSAPAPAADRLYAIKQQRRDLQAKLDAMPLARKIAELEGEADMLTKWLIDNLPKGEASGIVGKLAKAVVNVVAVPAVDDWEQVYKYVKRTGNFAILNKRLNSAAVVELWNDKKVVPGIGSFNDVRLSLTKR